MTSGELSPAQEVTVGDPVVIPGQEFYERVVAVHPEYAELNLTQRGGIPLPVFIRIDKLEFNPRNGLWEPQHEEVLLHFELPVNRN